VFLSESSLCLLLTTIYERSELLQDLQELSKHTERPTRT